VPDRDDPAVFQIIGHDSSCSECARPLGAGNFLRKIGEGLCMDCADLAHLAFVPAGDRPRRPGPPATSTPATTRSSAAASNATRPRNGARRHRSHSL